MPIHVLPVEVASRIAAGEVVERPASAVKELVENSLDAGADEVRVEVSEGGRRLLRVTDNGSGIPSAEVSLAFERHATSKLASADDLEHITTLGFRGEALASIASVAQVTMHTRHQAEVVGTLLRVHGGLVASQESKGGPPGTAVTVEHLFYNVPARLKFLRQPATESSHIVETVQRLAMAFPERRFSLVSENRLLFQSTGNGRLMDVLVKVWGLEVVRQLVPIGAADGQEGAVLATAAAVGTPRVAGYTSLPSLSRSNRSHILLFLNRRPIQDRTLTFAVTEAYRNRLMVGRYPVAVVMIEMDPSLVDVNVHPAKAEVRFGDERAVFRAVQQAVQGALALHAPVLEARSQGTPWILPAWAQRREALLGAGQEHVETLNAERGTQNATPDTWHLALGASPAIDAETDEPPQQANGSGSGAQRSALSVQRPELDRAADLLPILRAVGQMGATYIVAEGPEGMYLVDQHAAHERILFEQMLAEQASRAVAQQTLLEPVVFDAGSTFAGLIGEYGDALAVAGFALEPFGSETWLVRAVPAVFGRSDPRRALEEVLEGIVDGHDLVGDTREAALVAVICKRAAVKGGQPLSLEEMRQLLRQLESCQSPGTCPHGRPTMLVLSTAQLEREFGRRG